MTKDEFIDRWFAAMKQQTDGHMERTEYGVLWEGQKFFALLCACGEEGCQGWAMTPDILVNTHNLFDSPEARHH